MIGCGVKACTSDLLIANCDEFIYYDDLIRTGTTARTRKASETKEKKQEAFDRVVEVLRSVEQDYDPLWGSTLKQAIRRVYPGFNESYDGYRNFSSLLKDLRANELIEVDYDEHRGNYKVRVKNG